MLLDLINQNRELLRELRRHLILLEIDTEDLPRGDDPGDLPERADPVLLAARLAREAGMLQLRSKLEESYDELQRARQLVVSFAQKAEASGPGYSSSGGPPDIFDEEAYLDLYPDVAIQVEAGLYRSGYEQWIKKGIQEGRRLPRPGSEAPSQRRDDSAPPDFDEQAYLLFNPDVVEAIRAGRYISGYQHWTRQGQLEYRRGGPVERAPDRSQFLAEMEQRPFGVNLYGFLKTASGLGSVARSCAKALEARSIPLHPIDVPPWKGGLDVYNSIGLEPYRINIIQQNADMVERFVRKYGINTLHGSYNIGYWLWELPSVRSDWHHIYQYVDEVWVASEFCRAAFQVLTPLPVKRVPLVVEGLEEKAIFGREHFGFPKDVFVFCYVFDVSSYLDRKNPFALIEAFRREFKSSSDVLLYLKLSNASHDQGKVAQLEEAARQAPNIRIYSGLLSEEEIVSLHNSVDCLVSPHRSEGFGFNMVEAMYFGKPVIATRYSSNLDYMNDENGYLIDCKLTPIEKDAGPYLKGSVWAEPSVEHLAYLLRRVFEQPEERQRKGALAAREIRQNYSSEAVGKIMEARFREIGLDRPVLPQDLLSNPHQLQHGTRLFHADVQPDVVHAVRGMKRRPVISVITPVYNVAGAYLRACIESVRAQWYPFWELCLCDDGSTNAETKAVLQSYHSVDARIKILTLDRNQGIAAASNRAVEISTGEYVAMLDNDDELAPDALYEVARAVTANPDIDFIYTDEDKIEANGQHSDHYFKPDWSPDHLRSVMYILHMMTLSKSLFYAAGGFREEFSGAQDYDLALRATSQAKRIHHIPSILYHWRKLEGSAAAQVDAKPKALDAAGRALADWLVSNHRDAAVEPGKLPGHFRVRYAIRSNPRVTLCIPTNDSWADIEGRGKINLLEHFVKSIAEKTEYRNYEILICDNGNLSARTKAALKDIPIRLVSYTGALKPFNFAAKANFLFKQVKSDQLVLLNDDMEVSSGEWLSALLEFSQQSDVGAVGARLLFANGRIQHVGIALGVNTGVAHLYHNFPADVVGYNGFTHIIRNYSAVTGACMATRKEVIERTGGFDPRLAIDYNDIDFCLNAHKLGYRIVYTPYAELYHFEGRTESRSRAKDEETGLFRSKWAAYLADDPYYNPNLTRDGIDFSVRLSVPARAMAGR